METLYVCDICEWSSQSKEDVLRCEKSHVKPEDLKIGRITFRKKAGDSFPDSIIVYITNNFGVTIRREYSNKN